MRSMLFKLSILAFFTCQACFAAALPQWLMMSHLFQMGDCQTDDDTCLKLLDGRFHVQLDYWNPSDSIRMPGHGVSLKEETGFDETAYFWFTDPNDIEAVVRVFDGCEFNDYFWVLSGSLTKVGYELTVTDIVAETVKTYTNPDFELGQPIQDTDAFATCPSRNEETSENPNRFSLGKEDEILILKDGRFIAEIDYRIPGVPPGRGKVGLATETSGAFYFMDRSDLNVYLKIIDNRAINGRYWLAYTSFTGAEYTLRVTDTLTDRVKIYQNPLNESSYGMDMYFSDPLLPMVYPWISNNTRFDSSMIINNRNCLPIDVTMEARRHGGDMEVIERRIPPGGFLEESAGSLFPGLGEGPGYCVTVRANQAGLFGRWVSNNRDTPSLASPSQGVGIQIPGDLMPPLPPNARVGTSLLYGFLPLESNSFSAPVMVNVGNEPTDIDLYFYSRTGDLLKKVDKAVADLLPFEPFAAVSSQYLSGMTVSATSMVAHSKDQPITGVAFIFNSLGEPALGNAEGIDFIPPD